MMTWVAELRRELAGRVFTDDAARDGVATDFGGMVVRKPVAVVRPSSAADVAGAVKFAAKHGLSVSTRGGGHSQTGQSLSENITLDLTSLDQVTGLDEKSLRVVCQGGLKWRALVERLAAPRLSPPVLTNNLDVTIGGTLSSAGLGVATWRRGTQADNCLELEVVTGEGEVVRCSADENRELFDSARAGMGQFGVITQATLALRRHQPNVRSYYLLYDDLGALLDDLKVVMTDQRFDYLESWCVPCPQGFKKVNGQRQAFAQWFYPLHATVETDGSASPDASEKLRGLKFYRHVHTEDGELLEFFARLDALFALWKRAGFWEYAHPWMECVLPWQGTPFYINQVLANLPPQAVAGGHVLLWPARGDASSVPLFMRPQSDFLMGFGILPRLGLASQASMMVGGKRYLSGWIAFDQSQWRAHYGDNWDTVVAAKKKFDPKGVLNPGFVKYE
jgi:FAD/FMN-containing dehydrogenase